MERRTHAVTLPSADARPRNEWSVACRRYGVRGWIQPRSTADRPVRVLIADDHAIVRDGIRMVLERETGEFEVVGEAADVPSTVRAVTEVKPDLLTLDLTMPGGSSLAALPSCFIAHPTLAVAILTMREDPEYARQALRAGARSYVLKEAEPAELLQAFGAPWPAAPICIRVSAHRWRRPSRGPIRRHCPTVSARWSR